MAFWRPSWKNHFPEVRFLETFFYSLLVSNRIQNRWKTFCCNFFRVKSYIPPSNTGLLAFVCLLRACCFSFHIHSSDRGEDPFPQYFLVMVKSLSKIERNHNAFIYVDKTKQATSNKPVNKDISRKNQHLEKKQLSTKSDKLMWT